MPNTTQIFGNPVPGDSSIVETIRHHKLKNLQEQFAHTMNVGTGQSDIYQNRGVNNDGYNTG